MNYYYLSCLLCFFIVGCASNQKPAEIVSPGKVVKPKKTEVEIKNAYYVVKVGDTILSVAEKFNIKPQFLLKLNKMQDGAKLIPGQRILVKPRNPQEEKLMLQDNLEQKPEELKNGSDLDSKPVSDTITDNKLQNDDSDFKNQQVQNSGGYVVPVQGKIIKDFGNLPDGTVNKGINIAAPKGVPVRSISDGVVKYAGSKAEGYGKMVMIKHNDGKISTYAHLNTVDVKADKIVSAGTKIGTVGSTGNVSQPQLQLQIRGADKLPVDPKSLISGLG